MSGLHQPQSARACHGCNRKKTKCDMKRPICGLCQRTGTQCEFPTKRRSASIRRSRSQSQSQGTINSQRLNENLGKLLRLLDASSGYDHDEELQTRTGPAPGRLLDCEDQDSPSTSVQMYQLDPQQTESNCAPQHNDFSAEIEKTQEVVPPEQELTTIQVEEPTLHSPNHAHLHEQDSSGPECGQSSEKEVNEQVSYDLSIHLINLFFDRIQCWLPLLHKPLFLTRYMSRLERGSNSMSNLAVEERLLLSCMFALSARYSDSAELAGIQPLLRENRFKEMARLLYDKTRDLQHASMMYLQACILLSFCHYTSGLSAQGWIVVGVCVRLAYELDLSCMDDEVEEVDDSDNSNQAPTNLTFLEREEKRRAWWLVWELDTFGSTVSKRPYAIDRHRMTVKLPISDDAWFSGTVTPSATMDTRPGECWRSLKGTENQDARAWFLVANHLMACTHEHMQRRFETHEDDKLILENEVSCFKLSLPPQMQLRSAQFYPEAGSLAQYNWIIGIHLMLSVTNLMLYTPPFTSTSARIPINSKRNEAGGARARIMEISSIAALWPVALIENAHPFFACMLLPVYSGSDMESVNSAISSSNGNLINLILATFARNWELGSCTLRLAELLKPPGMQRLIDNDLAVRYAAYFPPLKRSSSSSSSAARPQVVGKSPNSAATPHERNPDSCVAPAPEMPDNVRFDMDVMEFDRAAGLDVQEFNFPFSGVFGSDSYYSCLPLTDRGSPS